MGHRLSRTFGFTSSGRAVSLPVAGFHEDKQHGLWISTDGYGLYHLQTQSIRVMSKEQGLADRDEYAIYQDHSGTVWIGSWFVGLSRYADGKFTSYTMANGFPGTHVTAILEDRDGRLWAASHEGLSILDHGRFRPQPNDVLIQAMLHGSDGSHVVRNNPRAHTS